MYVFLLIIGTKLKISFIDSPEEQCSKRARTFTGKGETSFSVFSQELLTISCSDKIIIEYWEQKTMMEINNNFIFDSKTSDHYQIAFTAVSVLQGLKIQLYKWKGDKVVIRRLSLWWHYLIGIGNSFSKLNTGF